MVIWFPQKGQSRVLYAVMLTFQDRITGTYASISLSDPGFRGTPEAEAAGDRYGNCLFQTLLCQVRERKR